MIEAGFPNGYIHHNTYSYRHRRYNVVQKGYEVDRYNNDDKHGMIIDIYYQFMFFT